MTRPGRRLTQLLLGLALYGFSSALLVVAGLGLGPWDVLHQGLSRLTPLSIGAMTIVDGALVMLLWIPLRQRPGIGTLANALLVGVFLDLSLALLPTVEALWLRLALVLAGVGLNGVATALYIGAGLGPGPRDGLMTGYAARGHSVRVVRTSIEITVLVLGVAAGGTVGIGTVLYAVAIGPLAHALLPLLRVGTATAPAVAPQPDARSTTERAVRGDGQTPSDDTSPG